MLIITLSLAIVSCSTPLAQSGAPPTPEPIILSDDQGEYPLGLHLELLEDPSGELTIEDVSSPEFDSQFTPNQVAVPNIGFTESATWVRFHVNNESRLTDQWLLEVAFANIHFIDLYTPLPDGQGFTVKQTGIARPPETRDILHPYFVFNLTVPTQSQKTVYLRFESGTSTILPVNLWQPDAFIVESQRLQALHILLFGAL
ncbi:MAG: hypothetical protein MUO67_01905, partial [Anaerolineales bacterium]|nr:hypothetical protein [Anaerolineales bacterium]